MRIAFYAPRASDLKPGASGDRVFVRLLLAGLRDRGHDVRIVSRFNVRKIWRGQVPPTRLFTEAISIREEMKQFSPEAWIVCRSSMKNPDLFGWWQHRERYIILGADHGDGTGMPKWWRRLFRFALRLSLKRADQVVVYHPKKVNRLRPLVPDGRLSVMLPVGRTWDKVPSREEAREYLGLPAQAPVILSVSRFTVRERKPGKSVMILNLLEGFARLSSDAILVLVGGGPGRQRLEQEAAKLKPMGRVRFFGAREDLEWFYAACDFFAFPDLEDRPRLAILEAQGCGRPVVTMHTNAAELIVNARQTGLLAKDLPEFHAHVMALANDRVRCEAMGRSARDYITRAHSIDVRVSQIEDLLRDT